MSSNRIRVLLIDDDEDDYVITRDLLSEIEGSHIDLEWVATCAAGREALQRERHDVCLLDHRLTDGTGIELLREAVLRGCRAPIIMLTGLGDPQIDVQAMQAGAADFLIKSQISALLLERSIRYAMERQRTIEALRASEARYRLLVETSADAITFTDLDGNLIFCNEQAAALLGYAHTRELEGKNLYDLIAPEDQARARADAQRTLKTGRIRNIVYSIMRQDGSTVPAEISASVARDASDRPKALIMIARDITDRRRAEEAMGKLTRAVEQAADHLVITNREGIIEYINPAFEQLTGYAQAEAIGQTPRLLNSGHHDVAFFKDLWNTILSGRVFRTVFTNRKKNGELYYQEETISPIFDREGRITHFVAAGHDITERRRAEEALRQAEAKYRSIFENAIEGIFQASPEGHCYTVNPALVRMFGYDTAEEFIAHYAQPQYALYKNPPRRAELLALLRIQNEVSDFESQACRKDGSTIWISENVRAILNPNGEILNLEGSIVDISERKRSEEAIQKLATFPQFNPNPVLALAADGTLIYHNRAALQMARSLGQNRTEAILPPDALDMVQQCLATAQNLSRRDIAMKDRTITWSFFPIVADQIVHCYAEDITERLNLEAQLRQSQKMESIGQLAAGVAHDFNNLLTIIQAQVSLILLDANLDERLNKAIRQIFNASDRAANLTRQLLAFSRRQMLQPTVLDLNEAVNSVAKMVSRILGEDITLELRYDPQLPASFGDVGMLEQMLLNLMVNARDAMPKGGRLILTTAVAQIDETYLHRHADARPGRYLCLSVADTGCGMDGKTLSHLFEPFFTTKEAGKGTGLGLATVYGIVKQHQGWIDVESEVGKGSTFRIYLPIGVKPVGTAPREFSQDNVRGGSEVILVVEDEPVLRQLMREILEFYGYRVIEAGSGQEALTAWQEHQDIVNLLLTDIVMPGGMSGGDLAQQLQAAKSSLKVVFVTGYNVDLTKQGFQPREGLNFLSKPFHPRQLARTVRTCLDQG